MTANGGRSNGGGRADSRGPTNGGAGSGGARGREPKIQGDGEDLEDQGGAKGTGDQSRVMDPGGHGGAGVTEDPGEAGGMAEPVGQGAAGGVESRGAGWTMPDQDGAGGTTEPVGASGLPGHSGEEGSRGHGGAAGSIGKGGVQDSEGREKCVRVKRNGTLLSQSSPWTAVAMHRAIPKDGHQLVHMNEHAHYDPAVTDSLSQITQIHKQGANQPMKCWSAILIGYHHCISGTQKLKQCCMAGLTGVQRDCKLSQGIMLDLHHYVAGQRLMDEAATADDASQMDEADSNDNTAEQQECHLCSCRRAEINRLLEENRRLKEELAQKNMAEDSFKNHDAQYTGLPCLALLMGVLTQLLPCLPQAG
ncbi:hypothetical protein QQF64_013727 [Cirrhinus molitorella]|uniref:Uncharacterized protein n=1 Tax=Cirrhinus molitorella TaxID=172907 RepID=A0ABR3LRZ7_9TELE